MEVPERLRTYSPCFPAPPAPPSPYPVCPFCLSNTSFTSFHHSFLSFLHYLLSSTPFHLIASFHTPLFFSPSFLFSFVSHAFHLFSPFLTSSLFPLLPSSYLLSLTPFISSFPSAPIPATLVHFQTLYRLTLVLFLFIYFL